ncbi:hypothetical protein [Mycolicibacterium vaccae]|uniref:hypothetical protein n=1 Tax=Mycolicibacterium vaccae TaxID=1810 RepID=UPI003CFDEF0E
MTCAQIVRRNARRLGIIALAVGIAIVGSHIESGRERWSAPAWAFALEVPGSPATWGAVILVAGILILAGVRRARIRRVGYWIAFLWFCALAFSAGLALATDIFTSGEIRAVNPLAVICWTVFASMFRQQIDDERA